MTARYYILDKDRRVVPCDDVLEWARFMEKDLRVVGRTEYKCGVWVSTVFMGLDHRIMGGGPPLVFETMVFEMTMEGGGGDQWRYSSWDDAVIGHKAAVRKVEAAMAKAGLAVEIALRIGDTAS